MDQKMRRQRVSRLDCFERGLTNGAKAKDNSRRDSGFAVALGRRHRKGSKRQLLQLVDVILQESCQIDAEVIQRKVGNGNAAAQVFKVDHRILQLQKLLSAVLEVIHLIAGLVLDEVFLAGG